MPCRGQLGLVLSSDVCDTVQFRVAESIVVRHPDGREPEFCELAFAFHMNVDRLVSVAREEEKPIRSALQVHTANDRAEATELAKAEASDIVLTDRSMPGIDGWQAARILESNPSTRRILVVAVTAHALARETQAARDAGCDGVICTPFDLAALTGALPRLRTAGMKALDVPGLSFEFTSS